MAVCFDKNALNPLIEHHIGMVERYDFEGHSKFSVIALETKNLLDEVVKKAFAKILRQSDALINSEDFYIILLPQTGADGAKTTLDNLSEFLGEKLNYIAVTMPDDRLNTKEIESKIQAFIQA